MRKEYDQITSPLLKQGLSTRMSKSQMEHQQNNKNINSSQEITLDNRRIGIKQMREKMSDVQIMIRNREREFLSPSNLRGSICTDNPEPKTSRPNHLNVPNKTRLTKQELRSSLNGRLLSLFENNQQVTRNDKNIKNLTQKVNQSEPRSALLKSSKILEQNSLKLPNTENKQRRKEQIVNKDQSSIEILPKVKEINDLGTVSSQISPAMRTIAGVQSLNSDKIKMHINRSMEVFDLIKKDGYRERAQQKKSGMFDKKRQQKIIKGFQFGNALGKGKFGIAYLARHKETGFIAAIKRIQKSKIQEFNMVGQFSKEIRLHSSLDHPKIVKFYGFFEEKNKVYMVLEYLNGGTLFDLLNRVGFLSIKETVDFLRDVIMAVEYMHQRSIAHRDIKPENVVISTEGLGKLCDFGWASVVNSHRNTYCGTLDYASPEVLERKDYGLSVDIWSIGILAYEMLMGKAPFQDKNRSIVMQRILNVDKAEFSYAPNVPQQARQFIKALVQKDPSKRPKILELLNFRLFSNFGTRGSRKPY